jgi:hypothetical protein
MNEVWRARSGIVARRCARGRLRPGWREPGRSQTTTSSWSGRESFVWLIRAGAEQRSSAGHTRVTAAGGTRHREMHCPGCVMRGGFDCSGEDSP